MRRRRYDPLELPGWVTLVIFPLPLSFWGTVAIYAAKLLTTGLFAEFLLWDAVYVYGTAIVVALVTSWIWTAQIKGWIKDYLGWQMRW
jgi:hypothetical protein